MDQESSASLTAALLGGRTAPNLVWRTPPAPLTDTSAQWEAWIALLLKGCYKSSPMSAQSQIVSWLSNSFKLLCSTDDLWTIPAELRSFDHSLAAHLECQLRASADPEFGRRMKRLDSLALHAGKSVPSRKWLSMIAYRSIRDPQYEDEFYEAAFDACTS